LAGMIAEVQDTNQDVFLETLRLLQEEVESKLDLRQQARQSLALVRGTARALQAVVVAAMKSGNFKQNRSFAVLFTPNVCAILYATGLPCGIPKHHRSLTIRGRKM